MKKFDYNNGIRFECQGSGNCCVSRGSYGFVYLSPNDLKRFAKYFKVSINNRPSQCRTWPFWNENMNAKVWNEDISINCPGIGKGNIIKPKKIASFLKKDLENEKAILKKRVIHQK